MAPPQRMAQAEREVQNAPAAFLKPDVWCSIISVVSMKNDWKQIFAFEEYPDLSVLKRSLGMGVFLLPPPVSTRTNDRPW